MKKVSILFHPKLRRIRSNKEICRAVTCLQDVIAWFCVNGILPGEQKNANCFQRFASRDDIIWRNMAKIASATHRISFDVSPDADGIKIEGYFFNRISKCSIAHLEAVVSQDSAEHVRIEVWS